MVAKVAGGVICIGLLGTGSVALTKPGLLGMMPHYTKLSEDHDFKSSGSTSQSYSGKFGDTHKDKLVGVVGKINGEDGNKDWWEWSFKKLTQVGISVGKFKHVKEGTGNAVTKAYAKDTTTDNEGSKALNQVCKTAYTAATTSVKANAGDTEFNEDHVWKYCSWLGKKPEQAAAQSQ